jgi:hypothetical protein
VDTEKAGEKEAGAYFQKPFDIDEMFSSMECISGV